ncbi:sporulation protein YpjB [Jeotgalibacillus marinus]|uniref:Sporulation protein YpjB n=1 Tax=Jeotgalibacillus marinus TaxID=86667 RepID=A0ABV3PYN4_9BACL
MKNRQVIGLLMCFLLLAPFHSAKADTELDSVIQQITMKQYEDGVNQLHNWYITLDNEQQSVLHNTYSQFIATLSSSEVDHGVKVMSTWSFMSLAEYLTTEKVTYMRFLLAEFNQKWKTHDQSIDSDLQRMNGLYIAMIPTLQLMVDQKDNHTINSLSSLEDAPPIVSKSSGPIIPSFEEWYVDQSTNATLWIVSLITGAIVISTLTYVSWRKYEGGKNRKRVRNRND